MAFCRDALSALTLDRTLPPAHFYDYIWSAQIQQAGWRLGVMGVEVDHIGWKTEVGQATALKPEWRRWCVEQGIDAGADPMETIREYGAQKWAAFAGFYPCEVGPDWSIHREKALVTERIGD